MLFDDVTKKLYSYVSQLKQNGLLRQPIACNEIAEMTYDFVMTYVANRTINMTPVMLFPVGNNIIYYPYGSTYIWCVFKCYTPPDLTSDRLTSMNVNSVYLLFWGIKYYLLRLINIHNVFNNHNHI